MTLNCILVYDSITERFFRTLGLRTKYLSFFFPFNKQYIKQHLTNLTWTLWSISTIKPDKKLKFKRLSEGQVWAKVREDLQVQGSQVPPHIRYLLLRRGQVRQEVPERWVNKLNYNTKSSRYKKQNHTVFVFDGDKLIFTFQSGELINSNST